MTRRAAVRSAWLGWALVLALQVSYTVLYALAGKSTIGNLGSFVTALTVFQIFATVGAVVASHRPENPIGWLFLATAGLPALANLSGGYAELAARRSLGGAVAVVTAVNWTWIAGLELIAAIVFLFPDGHLPSPRWRPAGRLVGIALAAVVLMTEFRPGHLDKPLEATDNPVGIPGLSTIVADVVFLTAAVALLLVPLASLAFRYRTRSDQREQIKWLLAAVGFTVTFIGSDIALSALWRGYGRFPDAVWLGVWATIPVATGVAILRYRLYEIDRIIHRVVVYGGVSALLGAVYLGLVLALEQAFSSVTSGSELAVAGSTLATAALFRPARKRVQGIVDRRFYRRRFDATQTLDAFAARLRREIDLDTLTAELGDAVNETMRPAHVSLWLRPRETQP